MHEDDTVPVREERVIAAAVRAAYAWSNRDEHGKEAMTEICRMTGVIMEAHGPGKSPTGPLDLVEALGRPLRGLMLSSDDTEIGEIELLDGDELTDAAHDLAAEYACPLDRTGAGTGDWLPSWTRMRSDRVSREVFHALIEDGSQEVYVNSRQFIIENPTGLPELLPDERLQAGARPAGRCGLLAAHQKHTGRDGREYWWPCPVCKYPMVVDPPEVRCPYRPHRARFGLDETAQRPRLVLNTGHRGPAARSAAGVECVDAGVWRSVVVPGVTELRLAKRLRRYSKVDLWPGFDTYDLHVVTGDFHYDVKECASLKQLLRRLREDGAKAMLLLPDTHSHQIDPLRQAGFAAISEKDAVKLARRAAGEAR